MLKRFLIVAAAAASLAVSAASAAPTAPSSFTDPSGDSGAAADVVGVTVSNDAAGTYSFDVTLASDYAPDAQFYLYLDTDKNGQTGDPDQDGADYVIWDDHAQHSANLYKWNGGDYDNTPDKSLDFEVGSDSRSLSISVSQAELGGSASFGFFVVASNADDSQYDDAPSGTGWWQYTEVNALVLTAGPVHTALDRKQRVWAVATAVVRSDTGDTVGQEGTIVCRASAGGVKLPLLQKVFYAAGGNSGTAAVCTFRIPKKHLKLTATISVSYGGKTVTKAVSAKS